MHRSSEHAQLNSCTGRLLQKAVFHSVRHYSLILHHRNDIIDALLAELSRLRLDHDTNDRLCTTLADKNSAVVAKSLRYCLYSFLYSRILLRRSLIRHTHIFEHLRIDRHL